VPLLPGDPLQWYRQRLSQFHGSYARGLDTPPADGVPSLGELP
jgi:hypothetical protein